MISSNGAIRAIDTNARRDQAQNARPFPHVLIDDFLEADFAHEVLRSWPAYEEAAKIGKTFRSINERNKVQVTDASLFPQPLKELNDALASPAFLDIVTSIFGIPDLIPDADWSEAVCIKRAREDVWTFMSTSTTSKPGSFTAD